MSARAAIASASLLAMAAATGCVERRLSITSEPTGALVTIGDNEVGRTPLETTFKYHGVYDVLVTLDGYEPLRTTGKASAPLYEYPGPDLVAEVLPFTFRNTQRWHYVLDPRLKDSIPKAELEAGMIDRALALREQLSQTEPPPPPSRPWFENDPSAVDVSDPVLPAEGASPRNAPEPDASPRTDDPAPPAKPIGQMTPIQPGT